MIKKELIRKVIAHLYNEKERSKLFGSLEELEAHKNNTVDLKKVLVKQFESIIDKPTKWDQNRLLEALKKGHPSMSQDLKKALHNIHTV